MLSIDKISLLAAVSTDLSMRSIERKLHAKGYTLNYFAPPDNRVLLAEVLSQRTPNRYAEAFGGIEDLCVGIQMKQKDGRVFANVLAPRSATGPSFKKMAIGSGAALGDPVQATLKIFKAPSERRVLLFAFSAESALHSFAASLDRQRFALPLRDRMAASEAAAFAPEMAPGSFVFAAAFWGEPEMTAAHDAFLSELARTKKGVRFAVESVAARERCLRLLQGDAVRRAGVGEIPDAEDHAKILDWLRGAG